MNLFINSYTDKHPERNAELVTCLENNRECEAISKIFLIGDTIQPEFSKLMNVPFSARPTYKDYFNIINRFTQPNDINIIANTDIYFKDVDYNHFTNLKHDDCYALSRWDVNAEGEAVHYNNSGSQDTWIFRGAIKMVEGATFTQGVAGCDNKIAYLLSEAGYRVTNPSLSIKTYHLHNTNIRHYNTDGKGRAIPHRKVYRLPPPRMSVNISSL